MHSPFQLIKKYIHYRLIAKNGQGHGIHSPFVYDFVKKVLNNEKAYPCYSKIEQLRKKLLLDNSVIDVQDFGAGSVKIKSKQRSVKDIAKSSLKSKKYAQLLHKIVYYYQPQNIVELGTSLGITTAYLAHGNPAARLITCEGASQIASIAKNNFSKLQLNNIELLEGEFEKTLPEVLSKMNAIDFVFIDGNHQRKPTLQYFEQLLNMASSSSIFVFDDIHWSTGMEAAWRQIQAHPQVMLSIDLFFIGIIFFNPDFKVKQHLTIRY